MCPASSDESHLDDSPKSQTTTTHQGFLADCMVDADPSSASRAGRARGKAIGISALAQACLLALMLIVPLLATSRPIAVKNAIPIAPYGGIPRRGAEAKPQNTIPHHSEPHKITATTPLFQAPTNVKKRNDGNDEKSRGAFADAPNLGLPTGDPNGKAERSGILTPLGPTIGVQPNMPAQPPEAMKNPVALSEGAELAQLISRVEPVYPRIALYRHTEGAVQLRAIIGRDGAVRELQVISGDAILAFAAQEAVKQWRFRPTMLNGRPVEVDTFFTVVFKIRQ
jgi:TonB family protein